MELKQLDYEILGELMKNARSSDREIAKKLKISQPTVSRKRKKLEKNLSLSYFAVPDWSRISFQVIAFTFGRWRRQTLHDEKRAEAETFVSKYPNIVFMTTGQGMGFDRVGISIHKSYRDYVRFMQDVRLTWGKYLESIESFVVSIGGDHIVRPITTRYMSEYLQKEEKRHEA